MDGWSRLLPWRHSRAPRCIFGYVTGSQLGMPLSLEDIFQRLESFSVVTIGRGVLLASSV